MAERILLVEDDSRLAEMLLEYLGQAGFVITVAPLGAAALTSLSGAEFDAIVLDLMLPTWTASTSAGRCAPNQTPLF